jgi:hypothetical protein
MAARSPRDARAMLPVVTLLATAPARARALRHVRSIEPLEFPECEPESERLGQGMLHRGQCAALYQVLRRVLGDDHSAGADNFVYYDAADPRRVLAPDAFVREVRASACPPADVEDLGGRDAGAGVRDLLPKRYARGVVTGGEEASATCVRRRARAAAHVRLRVSQPGGARGGAGPRGREPPGAARRRRLRATARSERAPRRGHRARAPRRPRA